MLRVFGCKAMVHIPAQKRMKLDAKSVECIYLGPAVDMKAYRLYNKATKKVVISRDVVFLEQDKVIYDSNGTNYSLVPLYNDIETINETEGAEANSGQQNADNPLANTSIIEILDETILSTANSSQENADETFTNAESEDTTFDTIIDPNDPEYLPDEILGHIPPRNPSTRGLRTFNLNHNANFAFILKDPSTLKEALGSDNSEKWKTAIAEEYDSLVKNNTWSLTKLPPGRKAIHCKWVFKTKTDHLGNVTRYKARLVAKGCAQKAGIDYSETYSPVVRYSTIRYLMSIAVEFDLDIHQMDVDTAFLQGNLHDVIYMYQPSLYSDGTEMVCKLNKPIYGLKQASREWNKKLGSALKAAGLTQSKIDPCVYFKIQDDKMFFIAVYVDDLMIFDNDKQIRDEIKSKLMKQFQMKDLGAAQYCIGLHIIRDRENGTISLDQKGYIDIILERFNMSECNPVYTPMDASMKLTTDMSPKNDEEKSEMSSVPYQEAVGSILYLAQGTRPDITFAINNLSRFNNNPGHAHWTAVKHLMRYLKGTSYAKLTFSRKANSDIVCFSDADWASDLDERRSCTGCVFLKNGAAISWISKRQPTIALSSTEAEYMALSTSTQELMWLRQLERDIWGEKKPTLMCCDNQSAIRLGMNDTYQPRTKHIDVRHHFIREKLTLQQLKIVHVATADMVADVLTKSLPKSKHDSCTMKIGLRK